MNHINPTHAIGLWSYTDGIKWLNALTKNYLSTLEQTFDLPFTNGVQSQVGAAKFVFKSLTHLCPLLINSEFGFVGSG